jgi:HD superfamily phosphohydrolase
VVIRDPVHGDIELGPLEARVLDCRPVQRLRGIRQLGAAHLVYPGCNHTRFEHALGTLAVAKRILAILAARGAPVAGYRQAVTIAALLHDVGFVPYGHFLEDVLGLLPRHDTEERVREAIAGEVAPVLGEELTRDVLSIFAGSAPSWASSVVSGVIDADLLDYLRRDAYYAGLAHNYDERIYRCLTVAGGRLMVETSQDGMFRPDAISELVNLLRLRYYLTERVYYHHAKLAAEAMLGKALERAMDEGFALSRLHGLTDAGLAAELGRTRAAGLVDAVGRRQLVKRAYVLTGRTVPAKERQELFQRFRQSSLRRETERLLGGEEVAITCLPPTLMKEAAFPLSSGDTLSQELPLDIGALADSYGSLWRLYVFAPAGQVDRVGAAAAESFDRPSEHRRPS